MGRFRSHKIIVNSIIVDSTVQGFIQHKDTPILNLLVLLNELIEVGSDDAVLLALHIHLVWSEDPGVVVQVDQAIRVYQEKGKEVEQDDHGHCGAFPVHVIF